MNLRPYRQTHPQEAATLFLALFLATDAVIIALDIYTWITGLKVPYLTVSQDLGFGESFEYVKFLWAAILTAWLAVRMDRIGYIIWSFVFLGLIVDDAMQLHETIGTYLTRTLSIPSAFGLRGQDFGELLAMAAGSLVLVPALLFSYLLSDTGVRTAQRRWIKWLVLLAIFGVLVDAVHSLFLQTPSLERLFSILEDGGELVVISFLVAAVLDTFMASRRYVTDRLRHDSLQAAARGSRHE
ncbi:MAG: hypothetical protein LCH46_13380 [Proteobacteria bacterium]|nr:hypothetical protein [Pseudomonadota bacterium]